MAIYGAKKIPADHKKEIYFKWKWEKTRNEKAKKIYVSCKHKSFQPLTPESPSKRGGAEGRHFYEKISCCFCLMHEPRLFYPFFLSSLFFHISGAFFSKKHFLTPILSWWQKRRGYVVKHVNQLPLSSLPFALCNIKDTNDGRAVFCGSQEWLRGDFDGDGANNTEMIWKNKEEKISWQRKRIKIKIEKMKKVRGS